MIEIREVKTKSDIKKFVSYPHKLYKKNENFVPFLDIDEVNKFDKDKNESYDDCIVKCFLAYKDGELVGRIAAIIQKLYNQKVNELNAKTIDVVWNGKNGQKNKVWKLFMAQWDITILIEKGY